MTLLLFPYATQSNAAITERTKLLLSHIRGILAGVFGACYISAEPTEKPHGRKAWTFMSHTMNAEVDFSVMPLAQPKEPNDEGKGNKQ